MISERFWRTNVDHSHSFTLSIHTFSRRHYLSGPIEIPTAQPGDLLKVEILSLGPLEGDEWGFTGTFAKENGGGFLTDHYPRASKAIWDIEGIYCSSRHLPGVRFAGLIHPGLIGTAPSAELLKIWNDREAALCAEEGTPQEKTLCGCLHTRPLACLPEAKGAMLGKLGHFKAKLGKDETWDKIAGEGARTVPGRENGGNCDIKNLSRGSIVYFPVFVPGAKLSMGDMHFSQGDGEVSFCGAIEMVRTRGLVLCHSHCFRFVVSHAVLLFCSAVGLLGFEM